MKSQISVQAHRPHLKMWHSKSQSEVHLYICIYIISHVRKLRGQIKKLSGGLNIYKAQSM